MMKLIKNSEPLSGQYQPYPTFGLPVDFSPQGSRRRSEGVPVAKPGHLARQAGRKVRPPGGKIFQNFLNDFQN